MLQSYCNFYSLFEFPKRCNSHTRVVLQFALQGCIATYFLKRACRRNFPILRSTPALDVGIPVCLAKFCFACVIPKALFHEKVNPGIPVPFDLFAILLSEF